jgi:hypothetical protein
MINEKEAVSKICLPALETGFLKNFLDSFFFFPGK